MKQMIKKLAQIFMLIGFCVGVGVAPASAGDKLMSKPEGQAWLSMPVSGVIEQVFVSSGQHVKKGDKLVALETELPRAALKAAEVAMNAASGDWQEAKRSFDRAQELFDQTLLSTVDLQKARLDYQRAEADYQQKRLDWIRARYTFDKSVLKAPFDGVVKARRVEPGEYVASEFAPRVLIILER